MSHLQDEKTVVQLPQRKMEDAITYLDYRRIPETLEMCDRQLNDNRDEALKSAVDGMRTWCLQTLEVLEIARRSGEISDADYILLTTKRDLSDDERLKLRERAAFFQPEPFAIAADGRQVYLLNTVAGWITVTQEPEGWAIYTIPPPV